jgi:hypothetical protein
MQQHLDPVTAATKHYAATTTQSQWDYATERATESVMSDMDTLHDWLYASVVGMTSCNPNVLARLVTMDDADITELGNDALIALMWNASNDLSNSARHELQRRYLIHRAADVMAKANELVASECAA